MDDLDVDQGDGRKARHIGDQRDGARNRETAEGLQRGIKAATAMPDLGDPRVDVLDAVGYRYGQHQERNQNGERVQAQAEQRQQPEFPDHRDDGAGHRQEGHLHRPRVTPEQQRGHQQRQAEKADHFQRGIGDVTDHLGEPDDVDLQVRVVLRIVGGDDLQVAVVKGDGLGLARCLGQGDGLLPEPPFQPARFAVVAADDGAGFHVTTRFPEAVLPHRRAFNPSADGFQQVGDMGVVHLLTGLRVDLQQLGHHHGAGFILGNQASDDLCLADIRLDDVEHLGRWSVIRGDDVAPLEALLSNLDEAHVGREQTHHPRPVDIRQEEDLVGDLLQGGQKAFVVDLTFFLHERHQHQVGAAELAVVLLERPHVGMFHGDGFFVASVRLDAGGVVAEEHRQRRQDKKGQGRFAKDQWFHHAENGASNRRVRQ